MVEILTVSRAVGRFGHSGKSSLARKIQNKLRRTAVDGAYTAAGSGVVTIFGMPEPEFTTLDGPAIGPARRAQKIRASGLPAGPKFQH
ncbi:hypothetical protein L484_025222 [Morus notabilis]|uniref:Uncharacterized protein n=1 Tax=Morus notabilis TaxID=981085 RepID=W9SIN4_9ROSA|nr:hypothetical protein L484_025222 [Morus notabilis]